MPDIEFLPASDDNIGAEEELSGGPRRTLLVTLGAAAAAAALLGLLVSRLSSDEGTPGPSVPSVADVHPRIVDSASRTIPLDLGQASSDPVLDVAVVRGAMWVLQSGGLHVLREHSPRTDLVVPAAMRNPHLIADPSSDAVWLVANGIAQRYRADNAQIVAGFVLPTFAAATAMDDVLYYADGDSVHAIGPRGGPPQRVFLAPHQIAALVADPSRHRLLLADLGSPAGVYAVSPRGSTVAASVDMIKPTLGVASGTIWLAGYTTGAGNLLRLDPQTLRPVGRSPIDAQFGPGAILGSAGSHVLWVRDGGGENRLRCIDAADGRALAQWEEGGPVASTTGRAVAGTSIGAEQLVLGRCSG